MLAVLDRPITVLHSGPRHHYLARIRTIKAAEAGLNICLINTNNECVFVRLDAPFDKGTHDLTFEAIDVGEIKTIVAAPETGTWAVHEIVIDRKRFVYEDGDVIGGRGGDMAAVLVPKVAHVITREMKEQWDDDYDQFKNQLTLGTLQLSAIGTALTAAIVGQDQAFAYASGGGLALVYAFLLQWEIDAIGRSLSTQVVASFSLVRLAGIFGLAAAIVTTHHEHIKSNNSIFIFGLLGFMSYKVSIVQKSVMNRTNRKK
jgi:hypothetical protein